jgi:hypothetical protein
MGLQCERRIITMDRKTKTAIITAGAIIVAAVITAIIGPPVVDLLRKQPQPPPSIVSQSELEQELSRANITLSEMGAERVGQVREWLRNDPAYQALAQICLTLLADRRVIGNPIPLEVIQGKFRIELGYRFDEYVPLKEYSVNHLGELKTAIFKAWKERNPGEQKSSFDEIIESRTSSP